MSGLAIASRYAKALFELAKNNNRLDVIEADLAQLMQTISGSKDLREVLSNPVVSKNNIMAVVTSILNKSGANELTVNFLSILVKNGRIKNVAEVVEFYNGLMMQGRGEEIANITSAYPLGKNQVADIETSLGVSFGKKIKAVVNLDQEILGGVIVRVGSKMLDASIVCQLNKLAMLNKEAVANLN
jgi:F-type H+-transporting ATPase subunit delta